MRLLVNNYPGMPSASMWFIILTAAIWLMYECYVLYYKKETISVGMHKLLKNHPILILIIGVLLGHWLW